MELEVGLSKYQVTAVGTPIPPQFQLNIFWKQKWGIL
jgi:hypothetical protein